jgi:hypothetical protein
LGVASYCLLPLACIWWPDAMGSYRGLAEFPKVITRASPGCIVSALGWVLLLMPAVLFAVAKLAAA